MEEALTDILQGLNPAQQEAAKHENGPAMIIAGAGSGKTRVLTFRLAYLIRRGLADPFDLLALTFTNKASKEMRARIADIVGSQARSIQMGTFHSIFSRILRIESERLGYTPNFTIYDSDDSGSLIKSIIKELKLDDKKFKPRTMQNIISNAKNWLVDPDKFDKQYATDEFQQVAAKVFRIYNERLQKADAMDFDDLLVNMVVMLENHDDLLHKYQHKYRYIMVDEYQDTNYAQYTILKKLAAVHENLTVVGDDAQSIYSFRGANIQNMLNFQKDYPDTKVFKLEQNYRSTGTIVEAANHIIANNKIQLKKHVFTENAQGELIRVLTAASELDEAQRLVDSIREQKMVSSFYNHDFAVLYRTNAQSRAIEDGLRRAGITYKIFGGLSFYKRKEIKDVVAYLRLALNPSDEEAFKRVVNYPARGIGNTTIERLVAGAAQHGLTLWQAAEKADQLGLGRSVGALKNFVTMVKSFQAMAFTNPAQETVTFVARHSGILKELHKEQTPESRSRWENVQELINAAKEHADSEIEDKTLKGFLAEIALYTDQDAEVEDNDFVTLMTIHAAKGLEFKSVFVVGLEEDLFPSAMSINSREDMEEERRLFYVAVTRAEERLTITHAKSRLRFGSLTHPEPSRFLEELDEKLVKRNQIPIERFDKPKTQKPEPRREGHLIPVNKVERIPQHKPDPNFKPSDTSSLQAGDKVVHNRFGNGTVVEVDGDGGGRRAVIDFKISGKKTLILKYAKLKVE